MENNHTTLPDGFVIIPYDKGRNFICRSLRGVCVPIEENKTADDGDMNGLEQNESRT